MFCISHATIVDGRWMVEELVNLGITASISSFLFNNPHFAHHLPWTVNNVFISFQYFLLGGYIVQTCPPSTHTRASFWVWHQLNLIENYALWLPHSQCQITCRAWEISAGIRNGSEISRGRLAQRRKWWREGGKDCWCMQSPLSVYTHVMSTWLRRKWISNCLTNAGPRLMRY